MINYEFYAKSPVLFKNNIIFATNNSLYKFNRELKTVENFLITNNEIKNLKISNDNLIFVSEFEGGPDLYLMNLRTNKISRLTFTEDAFIKPIYFKDNELVFISSEHSAISNHLVQSYEINIQSNEIKKFNYHSIYGLTKDNENNIFTQKNEYGYLSWKNYKGGSRGKIYKNDSLLINLPGQAISPVFYEKRIYFIYEDDNDTNIYSCNTKGKDLIKHTNHKKFKLQGLEIQNNEIIYTQMGEIYIFHIEKNKSELIEINLNIQQPNEKQKLHTQYLTSIENNEDKIVCAIRGNIFEKNLYSGGLKQISSELRYVHTGFLDKKIFGIKEGRESELHIFEDEKIIKHKLESQKIENVAVSKTGWIAFSNHKGELSIINEKGELYLIAKTIQTINKFEWSKNGNWLVYELPKDNSSSVVLFNLKEKYNSYIIDDEYQNTNPTIDSDNNYIAFLSNRNLKIKMDEVKFDYNFDIKTNAYYVPLIKNFNILKPWISEKKEETKKENSLENNKEEEIKETSKEKEEVFELKNISDKITPLNINHKLEEIYALENQILGVISDEKRVIYSLKTLKEEFISEKQEELLVTNNKKSIAIINENTILISDINEKSEEDNWKTSKINLNNQYSKTEIKEELNNIFEELTWFMEEFFWSEETIASFKEKVKEYKKFLSRIHTSSELYEILKQIQGEMKTSHSYIFQPYKKNNKGYLAIKTKVNENDLIIEDYVISTSKNKEHPLILENIEKGSKILKINGEKTTKLNIEEQLIHQKNEYISLTIESPEKEIKEYDVKTIDLSTYKRWRYENWVKEQEYYINSKNSEIAYIHIKDMSSSGFIDFFKKYILLHNKKAIIIDVRYNAGGHVSTLILEQLTKQKTGIDVPRHFAKHSIPNYTTNGNYVLLINENTASDGEIFAENFRQMKLGKIIGKRTWGGIVGIWPRYTLINNLTTSQPEFATIFFNSKQEVENYGVVPDIEIDNTITNEITPENDNQLNKAIEICNLFKQ